MIEVPAVTQLRSPTLDEDSPRFRATQASARAQPEGLGGLAFGSKAAANELPGGLFVLWSLGLRAGSRASFF